MDELPVAPVSLQVSGVPFGPAVTYSDHEVALQKERICEALAGLQTHDAHVEWMVLGYGALTHIGGADREWTRLGERADCCLFPVLTMEEVWDHPQVKSREITIEWGTEDAERTVGFRFPIRTSGSRRRIRQGEDMMPAPRLGEHNLEVFGRVGVDREELAELTREGVV